jgi:hypothetical protein
VAITKTRLFRGYGDGREGSDIGCEGR